MFIVLLKRVRVRDSSDNKISTIYRKHQEMFEEQTAGFPVQSPQPSQGSFCGGLTTCLWSLMFTYSLYWISHVYNCAFLPIVYQSFANCSRNPLLSTFYVYRCLQPICIYFQWMPNEIPWISNEFPVNFQWNLDFHGLFQWMSIAAIGPAPWCRPLRRQARPHWPGVSAAPPGMFKWRL